MATTTSHRPLPVRTEEITREWLTAALRTRHPEVTVHDFRIVDIIHATTTKIRLKVELDDRGRRAGIPDLLILKGGFEPHSRLLCQMHEREVRGYRDVLPIVKLPSPKCFFADYDAERQQGIIIMDDLVARGVTFCNALQPQTHEQIAHRLTLLAQYHAKTWGSAEIERGGRWGDLVDFFDVRQDFVDRNLAPDTWRRFVTSPRGAATSVRFHDREWMTDAWNRMVRFAHRQTHCVLHGDIHLGNLYIEQDGTPGFLDTLASRGPGMLEVSYHISASIDMAERRDSEGALVRHYLNELSRDGVEAPAFDQAMRQYGIFLVYGYFIWMTTEPHMQTEAVNTANSARVSAAMLDHDTLSLLQSIR